MPAGPATPSDPASWPTGRLLATASRLLEHAWVRALERMELTHAGLIVLHVLDDGATSQSELAALARVERQTMSRTIERLERAGYVERTSDVTDRRRNLVRRTPEGEQVWSELHDLEREVFPGIAGEDRLRALLLEIIGELGTDDGRPGR